MILEDGAFNNISYPINVGQNQTAQTSDLLFTPLPPQTTDSGSTELNYLLQTKNGEKIQHQYILSPAGYMIDFNIKMDGANKLLTQNTLNMTWQAKANKVEKDIEWETQQSHVAFVENDDYDFEHLAIGKQDDKKLDKQVSWVALKQQFFASSIVAKNKFENAEIRWESPADTSLQVIAKATANLRLRVPEGANVAMPLQLFYGPGDYKILKSYNNEMYNMIPLGSGILRL